MNNVIAHERIIENLEEQIKDLREENERQGDKLFNYGKEILRLEEILSDNGLEDHISINETKGNKNV